MEGEDTLDVALEELEDITRGQTNQQETRDLSDIDSSSSSGGATLEELAESSWPRRQSHREITEQSYSEESGEERRTRDVDGNRNNGEANGAEEDSEEEEDEDMDEEDEVDDELEDDEEELEGLFGQYRRTGSNEEQEDRLPKGHPGRVKFEDGMGMEEELPSERQQVVEAQLSFWGNSLVMFSSIGIGLYIASKIFHVDFERFLGMVMLGGLGMLAARPRYNPKLSQTIEHGLTEGELETIRTFVKRRVDLQTSDWENRDHMLGKLKRSSYSNISLGDYRRMGGGVAFRRRKGSRDSYERKRGQNYYPAPEPFEAMLSVGGDDDEGVFF